MISAVSGNVTSSHVTSRNSLTAALECYLRSSQRMDATNRKPPTLQIGDCVLTLACSICFWEFFCCCCLQTISCLLTWANLGSPATSSSSRLSKVFDHLAGPTCCWNRDDKMTTDGWELYLCSKGSTKLALELWKTRSFCERERSPFLCRQDRGSKRFCFIFQYNVHLRFDMLNGVKIIGLPIILLENIISTTLVQGTMFGRAMIFKWCNNYAFTAYTKCLFIPWVLNTFCDERWNMQKWNFD